MRPSEKQKKFVSILNDRFGSGAEVNRQQLLELAGKYALPFPIWLTNNPAFKLARGMWRVPSMEEFNDPDVMAQVPQRPVEVEATPAPQFMPVQQQSNTSTAVQTSQLGKGDFIPDPNPLYVKWGYHDDLRAIIKSRQFMPVYITGLSGNGKTEMTIQICAELKRDMIRINVTGDTDEDELFGGFRLIDGNTVWFDGPMTQAMEIGAVALLDESDLGTPSKIMCLQPVLEGKGILLKKINRYVRPAEGFTIVATANTKGQGSETGKFIATNIQNEAHLERYNLTFEQEYPSPKIEEQILVKLFASKGVSKPLMIKRLVQWADMLRQSYFQGSTTEIISTRRLSHIANAYAVFEDELKAVAYCLNRFDSNTKDNFFKLYETLKGTDDKAELERAAKEEADRKIRELEEKVTETEKVEVAAISSLATTKKNIVSGSVNTSALKKYFKDN